MSNSRHLAQVFTQVTRRIHDTGQYRWVGQEDQPEDYFDWGLNYQTQADDIIQAMIADGNLEVAE